MDQFLSIRKKAIEGYIPKKDDNITSDRLKEAKEIATEIYEKIKNCFIQQAANPTQSFLYFEYNNSRKFSSYDSEYIRGYPSTKILVMLLLEEICNSKEIRFLHEDSRVEGGLNWKFIKVMPTLISNKEKFLIKNKEKESME